MKSLKFGNVVLCDYVARGHANKFNLVNVISGDVVIAETPADLTFGFFLELIAQPGQGGTFKLEIVLNGRLVIAAEGSGNPTNQGQAGSIAIPLFPIRIEKDSVLEAYVSAPGFRRTLAMTKTITKGDLSSAFQPPS